MRVGIYQDKFPFVEVNVSLMGVLRHVKRTLYCGIKRPLFSEDTDLSHPLNLERAVPIR